MTTTALPVTFTDVRDAADRLAGVARRTPVMTSRTLDERAGCSVFLKCENFQRVGAFKFRGGYNAVSRLSEAEHAAGVVTFSSGNHAQAIALASKLCGVRATIVMPHDAPRVKMDAVRGYGAQIVEYHRSEEDREVKAREIAEARGAVIIPPFDHEHVIAGQGTTGLELLEDVPDLDWMFVCVGGGGLISGCALAASGVAPGCKVVGVEPAAGDDACRSFRDGLLRRVETPDTICDGAATNSIGERNFAIMRALVHDMMSVPDDAVLRAMRLVWERMKLVVEPTGALALAGLLEGRVGGIKPGDRVGVTISGGNVDVVRAAELLGNAASAPPVR